MDKETADRLLGDYEPRKKYTKKCGHPHGYRCSCSGGENAEKVFDCVDEIRLRSSWKFRE